jgi:hypothetical protein
MEVVSDVIVNTTPRMVKSWLKSVTRDFPDMVNADDDHYPKVMVTPLREDGTGRLVCDFSALHRDSEGNFYYVLDYGTTGYAIVVDIIPLDEQRANLVIRASGNPIFKPYVDRLIEAIQRAYLQPDRPTRDEPQFVPKYVRERREAVKKLYHEGLTDWEIAQRLKASEKTVFRDRQALGLGKFSQVQ